MDSRTPAETRMTKAHRSGIGGPGKVGTVIVTRDDDSLPPCPVCGDDDHEADVCDSWSENFQGEVVECKVCHSRIPTEALRASALSQARQLDNDIIVALSAQLSELDKLINTPEVLNFIKGVQLEAAHQVSRWGKAHDRNKSAEMWFWLVGYLSGKALRAHIEGNTEKALHHCISSAAALAHWHEAIQADTTGAGLGADLDVTHTDLIEEKN